MELIDLPGTYSLSANSLDERVAVDVMTGHGLAAVAQGGADGTQIATLAVIAKELNGWWSAGSFCALTLLAWVAAVAVYQIGMLF